MSITNGNRPAKPWDPGSQLPRPHSQMCLDSKSRPKSFHCILDAWSCFCLGLAREKRGGSEAQRPRGLRASCPADRCREQASHLWKGSGELRNKEGGDEGTKRCLIGSKKWAREPTVLVSIQRQLHLPLRTIPTTLPFPSPLSAHWH